MKAPPDYSQVPVASPERTHTLEQELMRLCRLYEGRVATLSEKRFEALLERATTFDVERGLLPGQVPHIVYLHSSAFLEWEERLWREINGRLDMNPNLLI